MKAKSGLIGSNQYYILLVLSNLLFALTLSELSVSPKQLLSSLISLLISTAASLVMFSFSYCVTKQSEKNVLEYFWEKNNALTALIKCLYLIYFVYAGSVAVLSYAQLFVECVNRQAPMWFVILLMCASSIYSGIKGTEALSRTAIIIFAFTVITVITVLIGNFSYLNFDNLINRFDDSGMLDNTVFYIAVCFLPAVSAVLLNKVKNNSFGKAVIWSLISYVIIFVTVTASVAVLGSFSYTQKYPIFSLSQTTGFSLIKGADGLFFALLTAVCFITVSLMTVCFNNTLSKENGKVTTVICTALVAAFSIAASLSDMILSVLFNKYLILTLTLLTGLIIPFITFLQVRRKKNNA